MLASLWLNPLPKVQLQKDMDYGLEPEWLRMDRCHGRRRGSRLVLNHDGHSVLAVFTERR